MLEALLGTEAGAAGGRPFPGSPLVVHTSPAHSRCLETLALCQKTHRTNFSLLSASLSRATATAYLCGYLCCWRCSWEGVRGAPSCTPSPLAPRVRVLPWLWPWPLWACLGWSIWGAVLSAPPWLVPGPHSTSWVRQCSQRPQWRWGPPAQGSPGCHRGFFRQPWGPQLGEVVILALWVPWPAPPELPQNLPCLCCFLPCSLHFSPDK